MTRHDGENEGGDQAGRRDRPSGSANRNGTATHLPEEILGCRRDASPNGGPGYGRTCTSPSDHSRRGEDEDPVFGGGDEELLWPHGDTADPGGDAGEPGDRGRIDPVRPWHLEPEFVPTRDGEDGPCWGRRRADECALDFLAGDADASILGDGDDLP